MSIMELKVKRIAIKNTYTIGRLYVDGTRYCDTLEDKVRDRDKSGKFDNGEVKVYGESAIPYGRYEVKFTYSPKFSKKSAYKKFMVNGLMPEICKVPHFTGIRIHGGNTDKDTYGCLLVGKNTIVGKLTESLACFEPLYKLLYRHCVTENGKCYISFE